MMKLFEIARNLWNIFRALGYFVSRLARKTFCHPFWN